MTANKNEAALEKLREAYTRIGGALDSLAQAKTRPAVTDDDLLRSFIGIASTNLEGVRELITEVGRMLKK